ncbi:MAG TPA: carboxypeptidase regulatory-like domain-containing protein [Pyrinomonadaceae bacterium]|jgi:plastocyanin|nr:carboxypeptidase regulatory-like domain-containing protein [Pyrinomonadaceae bacterium]
MNKQTRVWLVLSIALSLLALGNACSKETTNKNGGTTETAAGPYSGPTGAIAGVISFSGTPPAPRKIDTSADPVCGQKSPNLMTDDTVVTDGKLANVFVYIKDGTAEGGKKVGDYTWAVPTSAVVLDQNGCHYKPHVLGIQVNQKLSVTNSDQTTHNIHPTPALNKEWNQTQAVGAAPIEQTFTRPETLIPVKCNQHPWMKAYIGVMKHPFYAVSAENGTFEIKNVPAGKYTVVAWKEGGAKGTEKTMEVTVPANGSGKADFTFEGGAATTSISPSLQMMPALELPSMAGKH